MRPAHEFELDAWEAADFTAIDHILSQFPHCPECESADLDAHIITGDVEVICYHCHTLVHVQNITTDNPAAIRY